MLAQYQAKRTRLQESVQNQCTRHAVLFYRAPQGDVMIVSKVDRSNLKIIKKLLKVQIESLEVG